MSGKQSSAAWEELLIQPGRVGGLMLWGLFCYHERSQLDNTAEAGRREKQGLVETPYPTCSFLLCWHTAQIADTWHCRSPL